MLTIKYVKKIILLFILGGFLTGCGSLKPQMYSGDNLSTEHRSSAHRQAFQGAKEYCQFRGKGVKTISVTCPPYRKCLTVYQCIVHK